MANSSIWFVTFSPDPLFFDPKMAAQHYLDTGKAKFRKNGLLDMRYRASRFVAKHHPNPRDST